MATVFRTEGLASTKASWLLQDVDIGQLAIVLPSWNELLVVAKNDPAYPEMVGVYNFTSGALEWKSINAVVGPHRYDIRVMDTRFNNW